MVMGMSGRWCNKISIKTRKLIIIVDNMSCYSWFAIMSSNPNYYTIVRVCM